MVLGGKADLIKRGFSFAELPTVAAALCSLFLPATPVWETGTRLLQTRKWDGKVTLLH